jgi:hypothetical protein
MSRSLFYLKSSTVIAMAQTQRFTGRSWVRRLHIKRSIHPFFGSILESHDLLSLLATCRESSEFAALQGGLSSCDEPYLNRR